MYVLQRQSIIEDLVADTNLTNFETLVSNTGVLCSVSSLISVFDVGVSGLWFDPRPSPVQTFGQKDICSES